MTSVKVRFDGRVFVPDTPVDLPIGYAVEIPVQLPPTGSSEPTSKLPLVELMGILDRFPANPDWPTDGAAQHDHYLYGMPKRP
jgi:hypothetical protein